MTQMRKLSLFLVIASVIASSDCFTNQCVLKGALPFGLSNTGFNFRFFYPGLNLHPDQAAELAEAAAKLMEESQTKPESDEDLEDDTKSSTPSPHTAKSAASTLNKQSTKWWSTAFTSVVRRNPSH